METREKLITIAELELMKERRDALAEALRRITQLGNETPAMGRFANAQSIAFSALAGVPEEATCP